MGESGSDAINCWRVPAADQDRPRFVSQGGSEDDVDAATAILARSASHRGAGSPHPCSLFDFGTTDSGGFYYVMERLRGMDLQRMVERHGSPPGSGRRILLSRREIVVRAPRTCARAVHRDIKPANLFACRLADEYDFVKVPRLWSGLASQGRGHGLRSPCRPRAWDAGVLAPELVGGEGRFDGRADIYSLGCVAFWLLTGRRPFQAGDPVGLLATSRPMRPRRHHAVRRGDSPGIDALVLDCLSRTPRRPPGNADQLLTRLENLSIPNCWNSSARPAMVGAARAGVGRRGDGVTG